MFRMSQSIQLFANFHINSRHSRESARPTVGVFDRLQAENAVRSSLPNTRCIEKNMRGRITWHKGGGMEGSLYFEKTELKLAGTSEAIREWGTCPPCPPPVPTLLPCVYTFSSTAALM